MAALAPLHPGPHLVEWFAAEHAAHLGWLRARFSASLSPEELEETLQDAYARALKSLAAHGDALHFPDHGRARAWFRRLAGRAAVDALRARDGRRRPGAPGRPQLVALDELDATDAELADAGAEVEAAIVSAAERDHARDVVLRALAALDDRHVRILRWRYHDELAPEAVCRLEGLSGLGQYEGRMRRALEALRRALARLDSGAGCPEMRLLMRGAAGADAARALDAHLAACLPCRAFRRQLSGALGAMPLPPVVGLGLLAKVCGWGGARATQLGAGKLAATAAVTAVVAGAGVSASAVVPAGRHTEATPPPHATATPTPTPVARAIATATPAPRRPLAQRAAKPRSHRDPHPTPTATATATPFAPPAPASAPPPAADSAFAHEFSP